MYEIEATLCENEVNKTVFFRVEPNRVNEIVGDLYERGSISVTIREVPEQFCARHPHAP